jgi:hypothetical protein
MLVRLKSREPFAFVGLWDLWRKPDGTSVKSFTIITTELMDAHDVSPIANSAKYDGPECMRPVSDDDVPRGQLSLL